MHECRILTVPALGKNGTVGVPTGLRRDKSPVRQTHGSYDHDAQPCGAVMTMRLVSDGPRLRLFGGHADHRRRPSSYGWMIRTSPPSEGLARIRSAYPPSAEKVSWNVGDRVSCQPIHMMWKRSRWSMGVIARDPRHASRCSMRVHRKHECKDSTRVAGSIVDCADIATSQGWYPHMLS